MESTTLFCSRCGSNRASNDFITNNQGVVNKTCNRHSKKRKISFLDVWDDFLKEINYWSRSSQTKVLDIKYKFDLDLLPVNFGSQLEATEEGITDRTAQNNAFNQLVKIIWQNCGFRFRLTGLNSSSYQLYTFCCCQDASKKNFYVSDSKRDRRRMIDFDCNSRLGLKLSLEDRTLDLKFRHTYHTPYKDIRMRPDALTYVNKYAFTQIPSELYHNLKASGIPETEQVLPHQVYYQWKQANKSSWRRHDDQFTSSTMLLAELGDGYRCETFRIANFRALGIYICASIDALTSKTREVAIDATFGTNNAGMDLYALLAELEGTGVPIAYLFVEKDTMTGTGSTGTMTQILKQFLRPLQQSGLTPSFVGCDKDKSEINAIQQVWPLARVQLCFWHAKRAIKSKLKDSTKANSLIHYWPGEAQSLVPSLEICWSSDPGRRRHRFGSSECESNKISFQGNGRLEVSSEDERKTVLAIFSRHFNAHPLIPDINGTFRASKFIHRECTSEMYSWCRAKNYFRLWAYLFVNWYKSDQWILWARSHHADEIPVLKTTMIVESHWRRIKHDFLHRFNRPRIDMVIWILTSRSIPQGLDRMMAIQSGDHRRTVASWRKAFKRNWRELKNRETNPQSLRKYHTDAAKWTCACETFLLSRFLLCKHIVNCFDDIQDPIEFFGEIRRRRSCPFWVHKQLTLLPGFETSRNNVSISTTEDSVSGLLSDSDSCESFQESCEGNQLASIEDETPISSNLPELKRKLKWLMEQVDKQDAHGNKKFMEKFENIMSGPLRLQDDLKQLHNRQTMPHTWSPKKKFCNNVL